MLELNKIYCEDNLQTMARMPDGFIDLTVTSPPYDNLRTYNGYQFDFEATARELFRVMKQGGVVVWVVGDATVDGSETGTSFRQALYFKEIGFRLHDTMIWNKKCFTGVGSVQIRYAPVTEWMFVVSKGQPTAFHPIRDRKNIHVGQTSKARSTRLPDGTLIQKQHESGIIQDNGIRFNVWEIAPEMSNTNRIHPGQFPEQLVKDHILSWSNPDDLVYDCFMGSGTTAKAAHQLGRRWIGSEISSEYVTLANKRLEPYLAQSTLFDG